MVESPTVQILVLTNQLVLICEVTEVLADIGQPDCKLVNPYYINSEKKLIPWLSQFTDDKEIMMSSDKILTLVEPNKELLNKYIDLTQ